MSLIIFFDFSLNGRYFVANRLEELVDEGDSLSYEHESFRLVSQLHVVIQIL